MSMHTEFDKGSLLWVNAEIESTLTKSSDALALFLQTADAANLKHAASYLHQAFGALDLVELTGLARFCEEIEQVIFALERGELENECVALIQQGLAEVRQYLDRLTAGVPNVPLTLLPTFKALAQLRNANSSGAELFFPQLQLDLPAGLPAQRLTGDALTTLIRQQRTRYESGLLRWLKGQSEVAPVMAAALADLAKAQSASVPRSFWWTAAAVVDGLQSNRTNLDVDTKQLLLRLNLQIRRLADGSSKVAERLFRDMLYILANFDSDSALAKGLANQFELADLLPSHENIISPEAMADQQFARNLRDELAQIKELWSRVAGGHADKLSLVRQNIKQLAQKSNQLNIEGLPALWNGLLQATEAENASDALALEMATGLLLAENALLIYPSQAEDYTEQVNALLARLDDPQANVDLPQLDEISREAQERLLLGQLANEMRSNLASIEEILDAFFRDVSQRAALAQIEPMLHQVQGALMMLERPIAVELCQECLLRITEYIDAEDAPEQDKLELLAEALSALGFYVNDLAQERDDQSQLISLLQQLTGRSDVGQTLEEPVMAELEDEPEVSGLVEHAKAPEPSIHKPLPVSEAAMDAELLEVYLEEAVEVLAAISANIDVLQQEPHHNEALTTLRRRWITRLVVR
jgi:chemosensory pili system protein ChpA (sensor histidine kinase/response regulator)